MCAINQRYLDCVIQDKLFASVSQCFKCQIVHCENRSAAAIFVVIGILITLWTNCLLVICYSYVTLVYNNQNINHYNNLIQTGSLIYYTLELIYYIIVFTAIVFFIVGIQKNNRGLLVPWLVLKLSELIILFCSCIMLLYFRNPYNIILIPFGILFFNIGLYIYFCVVRTYHKLTPESNNFERPSELFEDPPSYDSAILLIPD